ncbi:MAG: hypothetical protein SV966_09670 [Actinomycetota bacterium]|nr:hypothetical protein [Actinomycetota bacterium]
MLVDPEILRAFAGQVDLAAADIDGAHVGGTTSSAGDVLPGSTTQWAVRAAGEEHFSQMATTLSQNVTKMGTAVHGAGDTFELAGDASRGIMAPSHVWFPQYVHLWTALRQPLVKTRQHCGTVVYQVR